MAGKSSEISVVARAAPESEERTIRLRQDTIRISTEHDYDTTCDLFTVTWDSLGEVMGLGMDFFALSSDEVRRWDLGFAVVARILPIHRTSPGSRTTSALQQLRETRLWRQINYWHSRDHADGPTRDILKDLDEAADGVDGCVERLLASIRDRGRSPFPDDEFLRQMARLLREEDAPGKPLPELPAFDEFCKEVLTLAASDPEAAAKALSNAQKNAYRKRMPKQFMTVMKDEILRAYCQGMEVLLPELQKQGFCKDRYSLGFYRFFHHQKPYLDGLVPDLHPIRSLLLGSRRFIDSAVQRFDGDASRGLRSLILADFFGAIEAAAHIYRASIMGTRTVDLEKKKRKGMTYSTGSDLERLVHDKGRKEPRMQEMNRSRKAKKAKKGKKSKKAKKSKGK
jgi:hypothetical protein